MKTDESTGASPLYWAGTGLALRTRITQQLLRVAPWLSAYTGSTWASIRRKASSFGWWVRMGTSGPRGPVSLC